ncbi:MAG TPA: GNAT family protein [Gaiellaceae bacterium]|nr:GNAT family protein [Gaiellaceae bacterium]
MEQAHEFLAGSLVQLEPIEERHREELAAAAASSPESFRFFTLDLSRPESFAAWFRRALEDGERPFATRLRASGRLVGSSWLMTHVPEHRRIEIGNTWVVASAWGSGVNTEAKLLMLEHAFERLGVRRVEFKTEATNARSCAALAALPAQFEGIHRNHMLVRGGENRDSAWYSVIEQEWPEVRAALRARVQAAAARSSAASSSSGSST